MATFRASSGSDSFLRSSIVGVAFALGACSDLANESVGVGDMSTESVARTVGGIVNGVPSDESDNAVLHLYGGPADDLSSCTATLIAPRVVLTALHCVSRFNNVGTFTCDQEGHLATSSTGGDIGAPHDPSLISVTVGPVFKPDPDALGEKVFVSGSTQICMQDIAVVVLDRELEAPIASLRLSRTTVRREYLRMVGFGVNGTGEVSRFARGNRSISDVGFDGVNPKQGNAAPFTFVLGEGACQGDSGGPAFSEETGAVVGVYSISAGSSCTATGIRNIYTQVAPFEAKIREALEYAGSEPILEPVPNQGDGGAGGDTGASGSNGTPGGGTAGEPAASGGSSGREGIAGTSARAGSTTDPGSDDDTDDIGSGSREDVSCACRVPGGSDYRARTGWSAAMSLLGLAIVALRRRARRP